MLFAESENPVPETVRLTPMMRAYYRLRFVDGMTQQAVASKLGIVRTAAVDREARILARFDAADEPRPVVPGRYAVQAKTTRITYG
jgi:nitrate reductase beta subunit